MFKLIFKSIRQYKKSAIAAIGLIVLETFTECLIPFAMTLLVNEMTDQNINNIWLYSALLVFLAILSLIFGISAGKVSAYTASGFGANLTEDMFRSLQSYSFENIDKFSVSSIATRMTTDAAYVRYGFILILRTGMKAPLMMMFALIMSFIMCPELAWAFVLVVPLIVGSLSIVIYAAVKIFIKVFPKYDKLNETIQENISAMRTVKTYTREDFESKKFAKASGGLKAEFTKAEKKLATTTPFMNLAIYTVNTIVIFVGAYLCIKDGTFIGNKIEFNGITPGQISGLLTYGFQVLLALAMFGTVIVNVVLSIESIRRISEVLNEKPTIANPNNPIYEIDDGSIEFKNVNFKYSKDAEVNCLSNINLKINSGETIGIIGGTGSGKTTLISLISRIYDVTDGEVIVSGHNVKEYDLKALRNSISVVLQKNVLFSGTIKENLKWGDENATDEEIIRASKLAQADSFVSKFKDGYDTYIEQGGSNVSGGQKQRLCIARALLKKPKVLILDDSTSAVDTKTDSLIRKAFKEEIPDITKIVIAQRISSIQDSDKIIVLDNGKINAIGTHDELMKSNDIYKDIYESQNKLREESEVK